MLKKYYDADVLKEPFTEAVFRFSDGSDTILAGAAKPDPQGSARAERATTVFQDRNGWLSGSREIGIEMQFLENRLSNLKGQDFFIAEFNSEKHKWIGYMYNPSESIENVLYTWDTMGAKDKMYRVI